MKTNATSLRGPLSHTRFHSLHAIAVAGLLLGGLGITTSRADILYVASGNDGTILKFTSEEFTLGGTGSVFASGVSPEDGLAFDSTGNLYAVDAGIEKFTPGGVGSVFADVSAVGLAFDSAGNLYASLNDGDIEKFTPGGVGSVFADSSSGLLGPEGLTFDSAGNLYVADLAANAIEKFTPGGVGSVFATIGVGVPQSLAFDSAGNLFVGNYGCHQITELTASGDFAGDVNAPNFDPIGLAFTNDAGVPLKLPGGPTPVPEPSAWAMLAVGAGSLLALCRRKRLL